MPGAAVQPGINFYEEEGDGIMSGNAQSIAEMGLNTGSKRKSDPKKLEE